MAEYSSGVDGIEEGDLQSAIDLLYEHVESAWVNDQPLPTNVGLIKLAWSEFSIGLTEARNLVLIMEEKHKDDLREIDYFR